MGTTLQRVQLRATEIARTDEAVSERLVGSILTDVVVLLWPPPNTAASAAAEIGCSPRHIEHCMEGSRKWSGDAVAVITAEILRRHKMRNAKVVSR